MADVFAECTSVDAESVMHAELDEAVPCSRLEHVHVARSNE